MKITREYYVLMKPNTHRINSICEADCETVFLNHDYSFATDIESCNVKYNTKSAAYEDLHIYERENTNGEPSGFIPIYVKKEIIY